MYLLQQTSGKASNSRERSQRSVRGLKKLSPAQEKRALFEAKLKGLIERRDPSAEASLGLSYRAESFLRELKGRQAGLPYAELYYGEPADGQLKLDMARAMILGETRFVHFDRLALRVIEKIVERGNTAPKIYFEDKVLIGWRDFSEGYLIPFAKSPNVMEPESTDDPEPIHFTFHGSKPIHMTLEITDAGRVAMFQLRKGSAWRKYAVKLRNELNEVLRDYRTRSGWLDEYRNARELPGLSADELATVRTALDPFYSKKPVLTELARGKFFDGSYIKFSPRTRGYAFRCEHCEFPMALEIISDYSLGLNGPTDWSSDGLLHERVEERRVNELLSSYHRNDLCLHNRGRSSRTGALAILS